MRRHKCGATIQLHGRMAEKRGFDVTISSTTDRVSFEGNGVASSFSLPFRFFSNGDIQASLIDAVTGEVTALTLGIDYSLQGAGAPEQAGSPESVITMVVAPAVGKTLFVQRVMEIVQPTDIVNQGRFFPEVHETVFDRLTMLVQQAALGPSRTIRVPESDPIPGRLPSADARATKVFGFDENGDPITSSLSMSAIEQQPLLAQEAAANAVLSADEASGFADASLLSAQNSADSALLAQKWAENPEDVPVVTGPDRFSALHWAAKAMQSLASLAARVLALENIGKPFTKEFISTGQTMTAGAVVELTHSLGSAPKLVTTELVCVTAENGYSVGDRLTYPAVPAIPSDASSRGLYAVTDNATTVKIGIAGGGLLLMGKATRNVGSVTLANWRLVVRAYA